MDFYSNWINEKLKELKASGITCSTKKFNQYKKDYWVQISTLKLAEYIGSIIGLENVTIEPKISEGDADIKAVEDDIFYFQLKTPHFFIGDYGDVFIRYTKRFCNEVLAKSKSRFAMAYVTKKGYSKPYIKEINKPSLRASLGVLIYDRFFPPLSQIEWKLENFIEKAYSQLKKITEKSKKIILIDTTFYPLASSDVCRIIRDIYNKSFRESKDIDGIAFFSWNPANVVDNLMESTIIPVVIKNDIFSKIFQQPYRLYSGQMMTIPFYGLLKSKEERQFGFNKDGNLHVDGIEFANLKELISKKRF
jgi:hypothetical protein